VFRDNVRVVQTLVCCVQEAVCQRNSLPTGEDSLGPLVAVLDRVERTPPSLALRVSLTLGGSYAATAASFDILELLPGLGPAQVLF